MQSQDTESLVYFKIVPALVANKNRIIGGLVAVLVVILLVLFFSWERDQKEVNAGQAFSQVWVSSQSNPADLASQYLKIAGDYAGTQAGQRAQLQGAAVLFAAGNYADAQTQFQKFADSFPNSALIATAVLGVAASLEAQSKTDAALDAYRKVLDTYTDETSQLVAKFATARIYEQSGKVSDALRYYQEIAHTAPSSALGQQASLKAVELSATLPKAPAAPAPMTSIPTLPLSK